MATNINSSYTSNLFKTANLAGKTSNQSKNSSATKDLMSQYGGNYSVEISESGLNALNQAKVDDSAEKNVLFDESKLSQEAQDYLKKLRDKYGDYDFIIADNVDNPQSLTQPSDKNYSVILSSEEIEKMARDEEYSNKVMGYIGDAVKTIDSLFEESLGEGVQLASVSATIDSDGNTKLFASIEKMSADQQERFEKLKEKRAEEKKQAETNAAEKTEEVKGDDAEKAETETVFAKVANVEADDKDSLLEKIFAIDWDNIEEQEFDF